MKKFMLSFNDTVLAALNTQLDGLGSYAPTSKSMIHIGLIDNRVTSSRNPPRRTDGTGNWILKEIP
jgi:hypothetical protein